METRPQWHVAFLSPKWGETVLFEVGSCLRGDPAWGPPNSEGRGQSCLWLSRSLFLWSLNTQGWTEGPGPGRGSSQCHQARSAAYCQLCVRHDPVAVLHRGGDNGAVM